MRFSHFLIGLVGFAGLGFAAPTLVATAVGAVETLPIRIPNGQVPDRYCALIYGPPGNTPRTAIDVAFLGVCFKLPEGITHRVTYIMQHGGLVCKYFDSECSGDETFTLDSCHREQINSVARDHSYRIGFALCQQHDWVRGEPEINSTPLETRDTDIASSKPGKVRICDKKGVGQDCSDIDALNGCKPILPAIDKDSRTIQQSEHSICHYYDDIRCSPEHTLVAMGSSGRPKKMPANLAKLPLTAVHCVARTNSTDLVEVYPVESRAVEASAIHARAIEDRPIETLDDTFSALNTSDVVFCTENDCGLVRSFKKECTTIPPHYTSGHITKIVQGRGAFCRYYKSKVCDEATFNHETTSKPTEDSTLVGAVNNIVAVSCEPTAGWIRACKPVAPGQELEWCWGFNALDKLEQIGGEFYHQLNDITQSASAYCRYYTDINGRFLFDMHTPATDGDQRFWHDDVKKVGAFYCVLESSTTPPVEPAKPEPPKGAGDVVFCKSEPAPGICSKTTALGKCTPLEAALSHQANNMTQVAGAYCRYYTDCGGSLRFDTHSNRGDVTYVGGTLNKVGAVYCELDARAAQLLETTQTLEAGPTPLVKKAIAEAVPTLVKSFNANGEDRLDVRAFEKAGDTIVCHGKDHLFCHENRINAIKQCANFDPNHTGPASLKQYRGAYCKWFAEFGCGHDDSPLVVDSREITVEITDLGTNDSNRLKSVKCETHPW
jgi:hypothetical protein